MTITLFLILVLVALMGAPLFVVLGAGALIAAYLYGLDSAVLIAEMIRLASSPNLMAIPLFTLAGMVLSRGGAPQRLLDVCNAAFGWIPGGLAVVTVVACALFTSFSGASGVTILALGGLLYPILLKENYTKSFSLGLLTSSGSLGLFFPPSLVILLYGIVGGVTIEQMYRAGALPGILLLAMLSLYCAYASRKIGIKPKPFSLKALVTAIRAGFWDLLLPAGVVAGIYCGFVTTAEAATLAAAYAVLLEMVIHRTSRSWAHFYDTLKETAVLVGSLLIILSIALGLTNLLIDAQIPMKVLDFMKQGVHSQMQFLLLLNGFLLVIGLLMDIFSAIVVVAPLIVPLAQQYGINPYHLGVVFLANLEIGYLTPPVGINLFLASQRFKEPMLSLFRVSLPFLLIMLVWLIIVTYFPILSTWWQ